MKTIEIIPYAPEYNPYFKSINQAWLQELFSMEPIDISQLETPEETIILPGGTIIFAKLEGEIVGTVALAKVEEGTFEMIKMGVIPKAQGMGVGLGLGKSIIEKAKEMGGRKLVLYSNSKLQAAIRIYQKLGFTPVIPEEGKYCRCDVKMELNL